MIFIVFTIIKLSFVYLLFQLYGAFKSAWGDIHHLEMVAYDFRRRGKRTYLLFGVIIILSFFGNKAYEKWKIKTETEQAVLLAELESTLEDDEVYNLGFPCEDEEFTYRNDGYITFYNRRDDTFDIIGELCHVSFEGTAILKDGKFRIMDGNIQGTVDLSSNCEKIRGMVKIKGDYGWRNCLIDHKVSHY